MKLTDGQLAILARIERTFKKQWRMRINFIWRTAMYPGGYSLDEKAALQQLRNHLGPAWLKAYRPGDEQVGWLAAARYEVPYGGGYRWVNGWRIAHADGKDMIQPYVRTKTEARQLARDLKITLIEDSL